MADTTLCNLVRQLLDQTAGDLFWPAQQIYDAANAELIDYWANAKVQEQSVALTVYAGDDIVPWDTTTLMIPQYLVLNPSLSNLVTVSDVWGVPQWMSNLTGTSTGSTVPITQIQTYFITDQTKLEQWSRVWRLDSHGLPKWFVLWDMFHLRVYPSPDKTYVFDLWGVPWPAEISATNEDLAVDRQFKLAIAYRIAASLLESTRPDTSDLYTKLAEESLYRYKLRNRNQQKNNIRRLKPGGNQRGTDRNIAGNTGVIKLGRVLS